MKKCKRVLFFISSLGGGGAERVCANLIAEFSKIYMCDVIVVSGNKSSYEFPPETNILYLDRKNHNINAVKKGISILRNRKRINDFIINNEKSGEYVLISAHLNMGHIAARMSIKGKKTIYVMHNPQRHNNISQIPIYKVLLKYFYRDCIVGAVSKGLKKELTKAYSLQNKNIHVIYNPIDLHAIRRMAYEKLEFPSPFFLGVGRLSRSKRFDRLIDIFYVGKFFKKYELVILGDGELRKELERKTQMPELSEHVHFLGFQDNPFKWMKNAEILINTSDYEALPMCIIEALTVGTKVVSSNCQFGPDELLLGESSKYLVDNIENIDEYIEKINDALGSYPNMPSEYIERFSSKNICSDYLEIYRLLR